MKTNVPLFITELAHLLHSSNIIGAHVQRGLLYLVCVCVCVCVCVSVFLSIIANPPPQATWRQKRDTNGLSATWTLFFKRSIFPKTILLQR